MQREENDFFSTPCIQEFKSLANRGIFALVLESEATSYGIYNSRLLEVVKLPGTPSACAKSILVVKAYKEKVNGVADRCINCTSLIVTQVSSFVAVEWQSVVVTVLHAFTSAYAKARSKVKGELHMVSGHSQHST